MNLSNDLNANGLSGERILTVFGVGATPLGTFNQNGIGTFQVSSLVLNAPIESFRLTSPGFDQYILNSATFTPQAIPFEFNPVGGVLILGGLWAGKRFVKSKKAAKKTE